MDTSSRFNNLDEYNKASHNIQKHISSINELLKIARIESTLENSEFGAKFGEIVKFDFDSCFTDVAKRDYYMEKEVDELWNMLNDSSINSPKKPKLRKANSVSILEQTTLSSPKITTSSELDISEINEHLEIIEKNMENITNMELGIWSWTDYKNIHDKNLETTISIQNLTFDMRRVEKDIKNSAATDQIANKTDVSSIDQDYILLLKQMNQVIAKKTSDLIKILIFKLSFSDPKQHSKFEEQRKFHCYYQEKG